VYVGIFASPIVQCTPLAAKIIDSADDHPLRCVLPNVPSGTWFVHAIAAAHAPGLDQRTDQRLFVDRHDPVTVSTHTVPRVSMRLRPSRPTDPPILLALPDLRSHPTTRLAAGQVG
jgi:AraC family transcriptional regulator